MKRLTVKQASIKCGERLLKQGFDIEKVKELVRMNYGSIIPNLDPILRKLEKHKPE